MKPRYCWLVTICFFLVASGEHLFAIPPTTKLPAPSKVPTKPQRKIPGAFDGLLQTSKLFVYTQNGNATTRTTLGGEFPSQLSGSANVAGPFVLQWVRDKGGKEQKAGALTVSDSSGKTIGGPTATMATGASATDVAFTFPASAKPGNYTAVVQGGKETSSKVTLNYLGAANTEISVPTPGPMPMPVGPTYKVRLAQFKPMVGTSKQQSDYQAAELQFEIQANAPTQIKELRFEVYSKPFTNSEILTASGGPHSPIQLFSGKWSFKGPIPLGKSGPNVVHLKPTTDYTKEGPGVSSPSDWPIAYGKTDIATFKWTVDGHPGGSIEKPLHTIWDMPPWKEKDFQIPSPPKGPVKIPGKK